MWVLTAMYTVAGTNAAAVAADSGWLTPSIHLDADWIQAAASVIALAIITVPIVFQRALERRQNRAVTLEAAELAYAVMSGCADRYMDPDYVGSEWWVPQWEVLEQTLAGCPIQATGSVEALRAFVRFRELFVRAEAFSDSPWDLKNRRKISSPPLSGLVGFVMTNAGREMAVLRRRLRT